MAQNKKRRKSSKGRRSRRKGRQMIPGIFLGTAAACLVIMLAMYLVPVMKDAGMLTFGNTSDARAVSTGSAIDHGRERRAIWCSVFDINDGMKKAVSESEFTDQVYEAFKNMKKWNITDAVVQVRPMSDALYRSDIFPWSAYISGRQGRDPGYDPLAVMVEAAHDNGIAIEAWINPYRVTINDRSYDSLSSDNPAKKWHSGSSTSRYTLTYGNQIYYNPAIPEVRQLIADGVGEILDNYDVDGIHMDDYFYPTFNSSTVNTDFDAPEYRKYRKRLSHSDTATGPAMSIAEWRRDNVNQMVKLVYDTVKSRDPSVEFGISPAGNIDNLTSKYMYYTDIKKWCSEPGYVDYIAPQMYWDFHSGSVSYDRLLKRWLKITGSGPVRLYSGLGTYRTVPPLSGDWRRKNVIARQVKYARRYKRVNGFYFFSYRSFVNSYNKKEMNALKRRLK
ncbi:MAG: family 10 glycosylhydrolase [Lachnospiraceae bacterium]|nr:family 10 glycosylhydrolase [Lachnospiraceae bacterium]MEE3461777.1 family 10 glycosylhydrolase [Lachnospiraceae bacterium]